LIFVACGSGTFGNHCSRNCHCVNQPCDPEDGTCPAGGCERGYDGIACNTGMWYLFNINFNVKQYKGRYLI
jgi:hypothetical protein